MNWGLLVRCSFVARYMLVSPFHACVFGRTTLGRCACDDGAFIADKKHAGVRLFERSMHQRHRRIQDSEGVGDGAVEAVADAAAAPREAVELAVDLICRLRPLR